MEQPSQLGDNNNKYKQTTTQTQAQQHQPIQSPIPPWDM